ncbi:dihydrodipicolinate synthase family protein [Maribacter sp. 2307ULW6-5]|uniref:dihydrodipicolinate synthase family protein n=1 Tax=Maribacter sp. 2307ULW6-5 TaxID=3386275 RepID=UPI0039BD2D42
MKLPLRGVVPPMVTPLLPNKQLDRRGLKKLIEHLLNGGVHGIFVLGTNGEGPSLGYGTRKELITEACRIVSNRAPVLVGITDTSLEASLEMARYAKTAGADALVVAPPFYFPLSETETVGYLQELAPLLPLPFLVYNIPSCTKVALSVKTIRKAKELGAIGVKDSSGDPVFFRAILKEFKADGDFSVIVGDELFLSTAILNGGHGGVTGGANVFPKFFVELYKASLVKDMDRIAQLRSSLIEIHSTIYSVDDSPTKSIKAIKCCLSLMGICEDFMALPLHRLAPGKRDAVKGFLYQFKHRTNQDFLLCEKP